MNSFNLYFDKNSYYRFKITDLESNGICHHDGDGWFYVCWNGKVFNLILNYEFKSEIHYLCKGIKLEYHSFDGKEQMIYFSKCPNSTTSLSLSSSNVP